MGRPDDDTLGEALDAIEAVLAELGGGVLRVVADASIDPARRDADAAQRLTAAAADLVTAGRKHGLYSPDPV